MKTKKRNVVLIGAGSVLFTSSLIADFIAEGGEWELRLVDINEENLEVAYRLAERMIKEKAAHITLKKSVDRRELLPGAEVVVTTIAVGGRRAWEADVFIPRKYGIYQPVGDTIMPGGLSRALRMIPAMVEIARDTAALAPGAHFFNYSNPMAAIVRAVRKNTQVRVTGLCHGVQMVTQYLANFLEVDKRRCESLAVGINHLCWILEFQIDGKDALPLILQKNEELKGKGRFSGDDPDNQLSWELSEAFDAFPCVLDRHVTEFFPQFHREGEHYGRKLGVDRFPFEKEVENGDNNFELMKKMVDEETPLPKTMFHKQGGEHEQLVCLLNALEEQPAQRFHVIIPNTGQVTNLPLDLCLECPAEFSQAGIRPIKIGDIPTGIRAAVEKPLLTIELIVEAALERNKKKFVQALILDGSVRSVRDANGMADELLKAHRQHLPGW